MRYILTVIAVVLLIGALNVPAKAEADVSIGFNVDRQPVWGPTGYDYVEYYYFPDMDVYYYVPQHRYYYLDGDKWRNASSLPRRYRSYNLYNSYKVVINEPTPYRNHKTYRDKYVSYKGRHDQEVIRDSRDSKYYVIPKHPEHKNWVKQNKQGNGNSQGNGKGNNGGNGKGRK